MKPLRTRRRAQVVVGLTGTAVIAVLGAGPALSASSAAGVKPAAGSHQRSASSLAVPGNVRLLQVSHSLLGVHKWYRQMQNGYPVVGGLYAQHIDTRGPAKGQVTVWDGRVKVSSPTTTRAVVPMASAIAAATSYTKGHAITLVRPSLWVLPGANSRLVWQVTTVNGSGAYDSYVDAVSSKVVKNTRVSQDATATGRSKWVDGKARVFDPNPVVQLQDESLTDQNDADSAVPKAGYNVRTLGHLDSKKHTLVGEWADVINTDKATSNKNTYMYLRSNDYFEEVMGYYALDTEESYYQQLGFDDVNAESQKIQTDAMADDNSWYIPSQDLIQTGTGGVDDAEDPEVVWHEDGHATQDAQVPGFGATEQAGAIGEGFGDYMAVTMGQQFGKDTKLTPTTCVMDWDSTSYTPPPKHCLRTTDTDKMYPGDLDGEVHDDGEILVARPVEHERLPRARQGHHRDHRRSVQLQPQYRHAACGAGHRRRCQEVVRRESCRKN